MLFSIITECNLVVDNKNFCRTPTVFVMLMTLARLRGILAVRSWLHRLIEYVILKYYPRSSVGANWLACCLLMGSSWMAKTRGNWFVLFHSVILIRCDMASSRVEVGLYAIQIYVGSRKEISACHVCQKLLVDFLELSFSILTSQSSVLDDHCRQTAIGCTALMFSQRLCRFFCSGRSLGWTLILGCEGLC